ncbi:hypothetical protein LSH36_133g01014 [Paralvinella palmiformis]|uniref:CARD domain-containing protein n=1 Tax=Paralvinella palmiformis TaxID=53620 RepID=A0AAD9JW51_9ANNE|nr:hypothetical protein LSH36_133g01014 [Paralvinella palmiformis]
MDDFERRVTKRRRQDLIDNLTANDKFVYFLRQEEILDIEGTVAILDLKPNAARISKLVDIICKTNIPNIFTKFCNSLVSFDLMWLSKEMKTDLLTSRGSNEIDDDVKLEAARLVELLRRQLHEYKCNYYAREEKMQNLITQTKSFLAENESFLVTLCHDMRSTTETLRSAPEDGDIVAGFKPILEDFFLRVIRIVKERDLFFSERQAILKLIGLRDDCNSIVEAVRFAITTREMKSSMITDKALDKDRRLAESRLQIDVLESRLQKQSDKLRSLTVEAKSRCETKVREADYLTKASRCRYKTKKRPDECLTASTSNINKIVAPLKTKSVFQTVSKAACSSPRRDRKFSADTNQ